MIRDLHAHTDQQRTDDPSKVPARARELGYEPQDWPIGRIAWGFGALFAGIAVSLGFVAVLTGWLGPPRGTGDAFAAWQEFTSPAPPLEAEPGQARAYLDSTQDLRLHRAPQPIEAAMRETAARGWKDGGS
ncbi:hypothetical protein B2G71_04800 [Novosphingobium sp. PC22D]|uniref:hypothetical protein n=1 Tax=Novosphingobium sp. PC22D TaxID=1962403 RepID=UPI000BEF7559|nr:hypothetical protein [Novosphingobium sp. PC22D]PEQ13649.1 hypothetical protein B2G71_04800 [Novosphingobium sp. PC22D]